MAGVKQPADKSHFILPDLGEGVAEAELIDWKVRPGDKVEEHQTLAEMETDKARVEVPSPWTGVVRELKGKPGDIIKVGATLVTYDISAAGGASQTPQRSFEEGAPAADAPKTRRQREAGPAAPRRGGEKRDIPAKTTAEREDAGTVVGSVGGALNVSDRFVRRSSAGANGEVQEGKALATPAVRRIARELGVDIARVAGSGRGGRVTAGDVQSFAECGGATGGRALHASRRAVADDAIEPDMPDITTARSTPLPDLDGVSQRIPFRGTRRKIAQALRHSVSTTVHFTVVDEADVTALDQKRRELVFATGEKLSLLPFIMSAVCRALKEHPAVNANVDDEKSEIVLRSVINLGCAVDTEHGLMVPVLADADRSSIVELSRRVRDVAARCQNRTIPREELIGGTFTISNVGSYGGMFATPIINYPEVAILAAGRAKDQVLAKNGGFFIGKVLPLSLSCDHRVVDGAEGARFLNTVVKHLEAPERLLRA